MYKGHHFSRTRGFTIVELLVVIVVIAILAAITIVAYNGITNSAKNSSAQAAVEQATKKVLAYMVTNADQVPPDLATAGITNQGSTTYQYSLDTSTNPQRFCVTATTSGVSYFENNTTQTSPASGACPGHGANGATAITNLMPNPSLEGTLVGWNTIWVNGSGYTGSPSTVQKLFGSRSYLLTGPATMVDRYLENQSIVALNPGTYTWSVWVYLTNTGTTFQNRYIWLGCGSGSCGAIQNLAYDQGKLNQWQRVTGTLTVNTTANLWIRFYVPTNSSLYIDGMMLTQGSTLYAYGDGDSQNWVWNGTAPQASSTGSPL